MRAPTGTGLPLPPPALRERVAGTADGDSFDRSGMLSLLDLKRGLASIGRDLDEFTDILDWGCGCGRILRHLPQREGRSLHGNDIDAEALDWVAGNMPWVRTSRTDGLPPLPYPDGAFDLVFNHSVMTHLDETYQDAWLAELRRVTRPGGIVTLTVHGRHAFDQHLAALAAAAPDRVADAVASYADGLYYTRDDHWGAYFPDFYHSSFHEVGYVFAHWSRFLDLRSYIARGALGYQDLVVLENTGEAPGAAQAADRTSHFENAGIAAELGRERAARLEAERSLEAMRSSTSWRITAPLRGLGARLGRR